MTVLCLHVAATSATVCKQLANVLLLLSNICRLSCYMRPFLTLHLPVAVILGFDKDCLDGSW